METLMLDTLVGALPGASWVGEDLSSTATQRPITGIAYDSRKVRPGWLFVALRGVQADGHDYLPQAVASGAACVMVEQAPSELLPVPVVVVPDTRAALARVSARFLRYPSHELKLIGVTGTNGKTSLTYLLEGMLSAGGALPGVIGTIEHRYLDTRHTNPANTTPESYDLQVMLREMVDTGVTHVGLEVSSHALSTHRVDCCRFAASVFTNLSRDHLDFHRDMESYFQAKSELFTRFRGGVSVINVGDSWGERLFLQLQAEGKGGELVGYATNAHPLATVWARESMVSTVGVDAVVETPDGVVVVGSPLLGRINLENLVAAAAVGVALGFSPDVIGEGISSVGSIPGRMERVPGSGGGRWPLILVDYAHTPEALEQAMVSLKEICEGRLIVVFGCGGDRDRGKRAQMGEVAGRLADRVVVTTDNPRSEDPAAIIDEIVNGCRSMGIKPQVVLDRREAIACAVVLASEDDLILVAGRGHESNQKTRDGVLPFSDLEEAGRALAVRVIGEAISELQFRTAVSQEEESS